MSIHRKPLVWASVLLVICLAVLLNIPKASGNKGSEGKSAQQVCSEISGMWDERTRKYEVLNVQQAKKLNNEFVCILMLQENNAGYSVPMLAKLTYSITYDTVSVKKWGM
jgi:hypothetical protein